jgi:hypothetical protein
MPTPGQLVFLGCVGFLVFIALHGSSDSLLAFQSTEGAGQRLYPNPQQDRELGQHKREKNGGNKPDCRNWSKQMDDGELRLRILVTSSICDGSGCEDHLGGTRIWGTNLGRALEMKGHHVIFSSQCSDSRWNLLAGADVVIAKAIDTKTARRVRAHRNSTRSWRPILVATKTNLKIGARLDPAFDLATAGSHLHATTNLHMNRVALSTSVIMRHFEVPTSYWHNGGGRGRSLRRHPAPHTACSRPA